MEEAGKDKEKYGERRVRGLRGDEPTGEHAQQGVSVTEVMLRSLVDAPTHVHTCPPLLFHSILSSRAPCCFSGASESNLPSPIEEERN